MRVGPKTRRWLSSIPRSEWPIALRHRSRSQQASQEVGIPQYSLSAIYWLPPDIRAALIHHPRAERIEQLFNEQRMPGLSMPPKLVAHDRCIGLAHFILSMLKQCREIAETGRNAGVSTELFALLLPQATIHSVEHRPQQAAYKRLAHYGNIRYHDLESLAASAQFSDHSSPKPTLFETVLCFENASKHYGESISLVQDGFGGKKRNRPSSNFCGRS